jgi:hypothetical protein
VPSVTGSSPYHPTRCDGCNASIWFAITTASHRAMPLDARSDPTGNVAVHCDVTGTWLARVLGKSGKADTFETLFLPHFATCTKPAAFRRQVARTQADHDMQRRSLAAATAAAETGQMPLFPGATR